jgi:hypothetical protein
MPSRAPGAVLGHVPVQGKEEGASERQNFDLAKYIVLSTRYEYSIQLIVLYDTIHCFYQEFQYFIQNSLYCHYKAVYFIKQFTTVLKHLIFYCKN